MVVEREQQLPIIELTHAMIDLPHGHQLGVRLEARQGVDDRLREVLVEGVKDGGQRPPLRRQVALQLDLEVERLIDRVARQVGVQLVDDRGLQAAVAQGV